MTSVVGGDESEGCIFPLRGRGIQRRWRQHHAAPRGQRKGMGRQLMHDEENSKLEPPSSAGTPGLLSLPPSIESTCDCTAG